MGWSEDSSGEVGWFSLSTVWVLVMELRSSGLAIRAFETSGAISLVPSFPTFVRMNWKSEAKCLCAC